MTKSNALTLLLAFAIGWVLLSFVLGTAIALNPILLAAILIIIILVLRSLDRGDGLYIVIGFAIGALVSLLAPALRPAFIDPAVAFGILLFAGYKV